jgi:hypothetical protein
MTAISFSECDGCGRTQPAEIWLGRPSMGAPSEWHTYRGPFKSDQTDERWACSLECMVQIVLAMHAERSTPGWWGLEPMAMPGSQVAHAFALRGSSSAGSAMLSVCSAVRLEQCEPASRHGLRPCKRCSNWADHVEPGWFGVPDEMIAQTD